MLAILPSVTVNPYFQVEPIFTPPSGSNIHPLYNTTQLQHLELLVLPSGGKYTVEFNTNTLVEITLNRIFIQLLNYSIPSPNQDNFAQRYYNGFYQDYLYPNPIPTYSITKNVVETLYVYGDKIQIDTTIIPKTYVVIISLPTYIPLSADISNNLPGIGDVQYIYPATSFMTNTKSISPQNLEINTLYGIKFTFGVSQPNTPCYNTYPFTSIYDIPDVYGNPVYLTINDMSLPNSLLTSLPKIPYNFIPVYNAGAINNNNGIPMTLGRDYDYIGFKTYGSSDGIIANYPIFLSEKVQLLVIHNNHTNMWSYGNASLISFAGTENGIKPYGVQLSVNQIPGYKFVTNTGQNISTTNNINQTLISDAQVLLSMVK